ncbi:hypothetical protein ACLOJK_004277 [Asimina triloba]
MGRWVAEMAWGCHADGGGFVGSWRCWIGLPAQAAVLQKGRRSSDGRMTMGISFAGLDHAVEDEVGRSGGRVLDASWIWVLKVGLAQTAGWRCWTRRLQVGADLLLTVSDGALLGR